MFNKPLIKVLLRENARLRSQLRDSEDRVFELIDKFVHNRVPERLVTKQVSLPSPEVSPMVTSRPSDAYSAAMEDADRLADKLARGDSE